MKTIIRHQKHAPNKAGVPTIDQFIGNITLGFDFLENAGRQLIVMKEDDFDVFDRIIEENPWITRDMLETILAIGKKEIHPRLILLPRHVFDRVCGLPYDDQLKAVTQPITVPPPEYEGRPRGDAALKSAQDLTRAEAARVWRGGVGEGWKLGPPSEKMTLYVADSPTTIDDVKLAPATTNRRAHVIQLDENGECLVQFVRRIKTK
jgi:hypothetical protein